MSLFSHRNFQRLKGFAVYFGVACVGFSVNVISRIIYSKWLGIPYSVSVTLAYLTAMVVGFVLTKMFAFGAKNSGNSKREAVKFFAVSMVALVVTLVFSQIALIINNIYIHKNPEVHEQVRQTMVSLKLTVVDRELASHLFGIGFGFFANYFGHKLFTFRSTGTWDRIQIERERLRSRRVS